MARQSSGVEPGIQGFLDRGGGCLWIVLITCGFRDCKRSSSVVISVIWLGFVTIKCPNDHQLNATADDLAHRGSCGVVPSPGIARPHAIPETCLSVRVGRPPLLRWVGILGSVVWLGDLPAAAVWLA
jgi:hypothetical protein